MRKKIFITSAVILMVFIALAIKPISFSENPKVYRGKVVSVHEDGINDAVFQIQNDNNTFYINRGFEDYDSEVLKSLVGKTIVMHCSEGWTPLDPFNNRSKSIVKLEVGDWVFFPR